MRTMSSGGAHIRHLDLAGIWQGAQSSRASESKSFGIIVLFCSTGLLISIGLMACGVDLGTGWF